MTSQPRLFALALAILPLSGLGACATTPTAPPPAPPAAASADNSDVEVVAYETPRPYGAFLAGRGAMNAGDGATATDYMNRAARAAGQDPYLRTQAFTAALAAGDVTRAAAIAPAGEEALDEASRQLGYVVRGVEALASGNGKVAYALLTQEDFRPPYRAVGSLLVPFAAAAAGKTDESVGLVDDLGDPVSNYFSRLGQGRLMERARRYDDAERVFKALVAQGDPGGMASLAYGAFLERRGRGADAVAVYDAALTRQPGDSQFRMARERASAGRKPAMMSLNAAAAEAIMGPAESMVVQQRYVTALAYLRLALRLDPNRADAWVMVGDLLNLRGDATAARAAYGQVPKSSGQYLVAQAKLAWSFQKAGDRARAVAVARAMIDADPGGVAGRLTLAEILRDGGAYEEAAAVLTALLESPDANAEWRVYSLRAENYRQAGRWAEAEKDLQTALALSPGQAEVQTALANGWIDRGENLDRAVPMAEEALARTPNSGPAMAAVGWGYYRQGKFAEAVTILERAVLATPSDEAINDHLGDAYWRVGRKNEAKYQWNRVLTLEPTAAMKAAVEAKIASPQGPDVAPGRASAS